MSTHDAQRVAEEHGLREYSREELDGMPSWQLTVLYISRAQRALSEAWDVMVTPDCTECENNVQDPSFDRDAHSVIEMRMGDGTEIMSVVVTGCEGYWMIDPATLGLDRVNWSGIEGVNIPA